MSLSKATKVKIAGLAVSAAFVAGLVAVGSSATGAYFSDTKTGSVTGTIGSIKVALFGGAGTANIFSFDKLLPGTPQTITVQFKNTGVSPEDVYLTFPNKTALSALNSLGTYGEVHVVNSSGQEVFASVNLNDKLDNGTVGMPSALQVASNVAPQGTGNATFSFRYASKLGGQTEAGGGVWNTYPVLKPDNTPDQTTTDPKDGSGSGLPIAIVATQVGQVPTV